MTRGEKVIAFIERYCRVPEGDKVGEHIKLVDFQREFILAIYDNPDGTSTAYLSIARKNGKTALIACLALAHVLGPEARQNSQVISGAMSREQAALVFALASKMISLEPQLAGRAKVSNNKIIGIGKSVEYRAISAESTTAHGLSPVLAILDEVGQIKGPMSAFVDAITTAQGAYDDALLIAISTQAPTNNDMFSIWLDAQESSKDPHTVSHVYSAPEGCDLMDVEAWRAANPALDVFRSRKDLEKQARRAVEMPSAQNAFRVLALNQRVNMFTPLIGRDLWESCAGKPVFEDGEDIFLALDLSSVDDLSALVAVSARGGDRIMPILWKPEETLKTHGTRDHVDYDTWVKQKFLRTTPGRTIDPAVIGREVKRLTEKYNVLGLAYDRWRIDDFLRELDRLGVPAQKGEGFGLKLIDWGQGFASMAPAIDAFERSVLDGRLVHPSNPVLTWCVANAIVALDPAGNRKLDKAKARFRIDGAVATAMVLGLKAREKIEEEQVDLDDFLKSARMFA